MGFYSATQAIRDQFRVQWAALSNGYPVVYENQKTDDAPTPDSDIWARLTVRRGEKTLVGIASNRRWRQPGYIYVDLFCKHGIGTKALEDLADDVLGIFQGQEFSGIVCRGTSCESLDDGTWYQISCRTEFYVDEFDA